MNYSFGANETFFQDKSILPLEIAAGSPLLSPSFAICKCRRESQILTDVHNIIINVLETKGKALHR